MAELVQLFGYLSVLLRAASLATESLTIGGIVFALAISRPAVREMGLAAEAMASGSRRMIFWSALALFATETAALYMNSAVLMATAGISFSSVIGATFFQAGVVILAASAAIAVLARSASTRAAVLLVFFSAVLIAAFALMSHGASRIEGRLQLSVVTALHQSAAAGWIGALPYLLMALATAREPELVERIAKRFSRVAMGSVGLLAGAGIALSFVYIDSVPAAYGTGYGLMLLAKLALFAGILLLGSLNYRLVRRLRRNPERSLVRLRRFAEAEAGIGFTIFLVAASMTSQPPAVDLKADRVTASEIADRLSPQWPVLSSPGLSELSPSSRQARKLAAATSGAPLAYLPGEGPSSYPNTPADIAWSEYNHHWAGIIVFLIGILAFAERTGHAPWARHWPLLFLALAVFLFLRSDSETWPLGPDGFFESFQAPDVAQHRIFLLLIVTFGFFEWSVRTGRIVSAKAALIFPIICSLGGALLLAHQHALGNVKEELLIEMTHTPLGLLGIAAGWARWLDLRLRSSDRKIPSWIWPVCFIFVGVVLLMYREA